MTRSSFDVNPEIMRIRTSIYYSWEIYLSVLHLQKDVKTRGYKAYAGAWSLAPMPHDAPKQKMPPTMTIQRYSGWMEGTGW
jgi:hypothetical protein